MTTILFISQSCLLDRKSGAAQSVRAHLKVLAKAGWAAHAVTMTLFDGDTEYPRESANLQLPAQTSTDRQLNLHDEGVEHHLYWTESSLSQAVRPWELRAFMRQAEEVIDAVKPDVVLTYCSAYLQPLLAQAQQRGARTVFYLGNPGYADLSAQELPQFRFVDAFVTVSQAMVQLYREKKEIESTVVRSLVQPPKIQHDPLGPEKVSLRKAKRYVTLINPQPAKGGQFFLNLVEQARVLAPGVRFRAVQSRWGRDDWAQRGMPAEVLDLVDWMPHTDDMGRVFEEAALLLVPSLWFEAAGRVVAEALLAGVPVLAMKSGGLEEQVNGGGFLFDLPSALQANHLASPDKKDLHQWVNFIKVLMEDDAIYTQAVKLALQAASRYKTQTVEAEVLSVYSLLAQQPQSASLANQPDMQDMLAQQRQRMNDLRNDLNRRVEAAGAQFGEGDESQTLYGELLQLSLKQPAIRDAMQAAKAEELDRARAILEQYLRLMPEDITALGLLAGVADKQEHEAEARRLMERVVALAPGFTQGHQQLLRYMRTAGDAEQALVHSFALLERAGHQPSALALHGNLLVQANRFEEAITVYEALFRQRKGSPQDWLQYALALKTIGQQEQGVAAYRQAIDLAPSRGRAWHALSNMKLAVFDAKDVAQMAQQLECAEASDEDRYNIHFTLGKAHEDAKAYAPSFEHYAKANRIRREQSDYDVGQLEAFVAELKEVCTAEFFADRQGQGHGAQDPVFVLGLHRAGSTLTEQILASHSQIEGTRELPDMLQIGRDFGGQGAQGTKGRLNRALLTDLTAPEWDRLGQKYLAQTRSSRKTDRPLFVDKMPANWMYTGLIHLMLPHAKIIDIRRDPMAAGFALFKMNFGKGVDHSYDQRDIARYYRAYADLMAHMDQVLPGRVHHIRYEDLVNNTEAEIRRLIDYCGLPFEDSCLRYWETERAVQTPSSEQVRQPIYKASVDVWTHYAPWLEPMREAFGDLVDAQGYA